MKNNKLEKIRLKTFGNIALVILWTCLIFIFIKGTISIAKPVEVNIKDIDSEQKESSKKLIESRAIAFAENFTREYMTYLGDDEDYIKRLKEFVSNDLTMENSRLFSTSYVNSTKTNWIDEETILVDCTVIGFYQNKENIIQNPDILKTEEIYHIRTAVNIIDNKFLITEYPTLISSPKKATLDNKTQNEDLEEIDKKDREQIEKVVKSFLIAYYEGKNTEIDYFVDDLKINEKPKSFKFKELKDLSIYMDNEITFHAKTSYYVGKNEDKLLQNMEFRLKVKDNKFIILKYDTKI
ncbi:MAG: conjugal transfer protein [Clostridiales bacterium]